MNRDDLKEYEVGDTFTMHDDHLKLLRAAWWRWEEIETGAPAIDGKRPYGNSNVAEDVAEVCGWPFDPSAGEMPAELRKRAMQIHGEMLTVLQIVSFTQDFTPGLYRKIDREIGSHTSSGWEFAG